MTDLEMTKLCAEAMGYTVTQDPLGLTRSPQVEVWIGNGFFGPLHDDAQAMALVKKFELRTDRDFEEGGEGIVWTVSHHLCMKYGGISSFDNLDLNRAIVECVAKMQAGRNAK
jgi:hypothetical protein